MDYSNQIRVLENQLKQLEQGTDKKDLEKIAQLINDLRRLRKAQYEENQRIGYGDE